MMSKIPKYVATAEEEEIFHYGEGDTPMDALEDFICRAMDEHIAHHGTEPGAILEVEVWTACSPEDSDWPEDAIEGHCNWCLDQHISIHEIKAEHADPSWYES
jgi:hypothetical protein